MAAPLSAAAMLSLHAEPAALSVANGNNIGSPRKRHRHAHRSHHHIQRPCLDFEKMQQVSLPNFLLTPPPPFSNSGCISDLV
jgi:hypothetical protein